MTRERTQLVRGDHDEKVQSKGSQRHLSRRSVVRKPVAEGRSVVSQGTKKKVSTFFAPPVKIGAPLAKEHS
jgi:hypothetical protein